MAMVDGREVQSNGVLAHRVLGLVIRDPLQRQLHTVPLAVGIGSLGASTGGLARDEPGILDRVAQAVGHHRVLPIDQRGQPVILPQQIPGVALLGSLAHEAQARLIPFVFHTGEAPPSTFESHPPRMAQTDPGSGRDRPAWLRSARAPRR